MKEIKYKIGFEDGEIKSYTKLDNGTVIVQIKLWNDKFVDAIFPETVRLLDNLAGVITKIIQIETSDFLHEALKSNYEKIPEQPTEKHYQFLNIDDNPCLEIVSQEIQFREN